MDVKDSATLRQRKNRVEMTLRHVENQRCEIETNTVWINQAAYHRRASLLDQVAAWYREELGEIDRAIHELNTTDAAAAFSKEQDMIQFAAAVDTKAWNKN